MRTELEITQAIEEYTALYTVYDQLKVLTVNDKTEGDIKKEGLRTIARKLGISTKTPEKTDVSKLDLIDAIWQFLENKRTESIPVDKYEKVEKFFIAFANEILGDIQRYIDELRIPNTEEYRELDGGALNIASKIMREITERKQADGTNLAAGTLTRNMSDFKDLIRARLNEKLVKGSETTRQAYQKFSNWLLGYPTTETVGTVIRTKFIKGEIDKAMSHITKIKNQQGSDKKEERAAKASRIKAINLVDWAYKLLTDLKDSDPASKWVSVVVAIGVLTGRRMSEIVSPGAGFESVGSDNYLLFTKQMKQKGDAVTEPYEIPVLGEASKIIEAEKWLIAKNRKYEYSKRGTYSKTISDDMKTYDNYLKYETRESREVGGKQVPQKIHFHSLRKIYAQVIGEMKSSCDQLTTISKALGDVNDVKTSSTYASDYQVEDKADILKVYFKN